MPNSRDPSDIRPTTSLVASLVDLVPASVDHTVISDDPHKEVKAEEDSHVPLVADERLQQTLITGVGAATPVPYDKRRVRQVHLFVSVQLQQGLHGCCV